MLKFQSSPDNKDTVNPRHNASIIVLHFLANSIIKRSKTIQKWEDFLSSFQ